MIADNPQACKFLLDAVEREMRRKEPGDTSIPLLGALLAAKSEHAAHDATGLLDKMVDATPGARLMAVELCDQLAVRGHDDDVELLARLSTSGAFAHQFGFRRSVLWALARIDSQAGDRCAYWIDGQSRWRGAGRRHQVSDECHRPGAGQQSAGVGQMVGGKQ